jgi:gluconate 5-dehydrogenase
MKPEARGLERFSLAERVVLVTGATRGLGLEIARGMAAAGAIVGINGRDPARAGEIAAAIPNAFAAPFDITDLPGAAVRDRRGLQDIGSSGIRVGHFHGIQPG